MLIFSSLLEKDVSNILCDWILNFLDKLSRTSCLCCSSLIVRCNSFRKLFTSNFVLSHSWKMILRSILFERSMLKSSSFKSLSLLRMSINVWTIARSCLRHLFVASQRVDSCCNDWIVRACSLLFTSKVACWVSSYLWRSIAICFDNSTNSTYSSRSWFRVRIRISLNWLTWSTRNNWSLKMSCWF